MAGEHAKPAPAVAAAGRFTDVRWVDQTGSTNADLLRIAADGAPEGVVVVADHQTEGRGRLGRVWQAPPGASLLASVLLRPPARVAGSVTMAVSVALVAAIEQVVGIVTRIKWPNDVVHPGDGSEPDFKLAGVLAEADWPAGSNIAAGWQEPLPGERVVVVVGTGVNVNWPDGLPEELTETATALNLLAGREVDRVALLEAYLMELDTAYAALVEGAAQDVVDRWRSSSATLGRRVRVDLGSSAVDGRAIDLTADGRLVVDVTGAQRVFSAGDVVHLHPRP